MRQRIGVLIQADPIENGFLVKLKYGRTVRSCYCEDEDAVTETVTKTLTEDWPAHLAELTADNES